MNAAYISVTDLQNIYAPDIDYTGVSDTTISGMINVASRRVDEITEAPKGWDVEAIVNEDYSSSDRVAVTNDGNILVPLIKRPLTNVNDVTAFTIRLGTFSTSLVLTNNGSSILHSQEPRWSLTYPGSFLVSAGTLLGTEKLRSLRSGQFFIRLSYSGGYAQIPEDMKYATALIVRDIIQKRFNPAGATEIAQGSMRYKFEKSPPGMESPLLTEAKNVLKNYVRVV